MADIAVENYKKAVSKAVDRFEGKLEKIGKDLQPVLEELTKLKDAKDEGAKKRAAELQKQVDAAEKALDKAGMELRTDLMLLDPPKSADPKEASKLPGWMKDIIKKGGLPLGKDVSVKPDIDIDTKSMKLKKVAVEFKIDLP